MDNDDLINQELIEPESEEPEVEPEAEELRVEPEGEGLEEVSARIAEVPPPEAFVEPEEALQPEEMPQEISRAARFWRKLLRWAAGICVLFTIGVVVTWFVSVSPLREENRQLQAEIDSAQAQIEDNESQIAELEAENEKIDQLTAELASVEEHILILQALVDVTSAQVALANEDTVTAKASLRGTDERLAELLESVEESDKKTVEAMRSRVLLVLSEIDEDIFAAMNDLEVLVTNLAALERSYFD